MEQLMEQLYDFLKPEGAWGAIVSVCAYVLSCVYNYVGKGKQWIYTKEKSSRDKYSLLFLRVLVFYSIYVLVFVFMLVVLAKEGSDVIKQRIFSITLCVVLGIILFRYEKKSEKIIVKEKYARKRERVLANVSIAFPIAMATALAVLYLSDWTWGCYGFIRGGVVIFGFLFIGYGVIWVDGKKSYKYQYARLYTTGDKLVCNVKVEDISYKGDWIIIKNISNQSETRFRDENIERVEYTMNKIN